MKEKKRNILIVKMSSLGDVILASPTAKMIKEKEPQSSIGWLVEKRNYEVLECNPFIDKIFVWDRTFRGFVRTTKELRSYKWDICLDLQGLFKSAIFCFLSGAKRRFGLEEVERGSRIFYTHLIPCFPFLHAIENYLLSAFFLFLKNYKLNRDFLRGAISLIKENISEMKPFLYLSEKERARVEELLGGAEHFVALCPGTTWLSKQWLPERWARVADNLAEMGYKIVFLGAKTDIGVIKQIKKVMQKPCLDLTGRTTIREAGAILGSASLAISVDSGAMHLATAVGTPVLALFGPTDPKAQGPYGGKKKVIYKRLDCSPCRIKDCTHKVCMEWITEKEVIGVAKEMLMSEGERP